VPSLTRGRVCNLQCNHSIVRVAQNPKPCLTPTTWWARFPYLYPPGTGWPSYTPGHWVPFTSSLKTRFLGLTGLRWRYSNPSPTLRAGPCIAFRNRMVQSKVESMLKSKVKVTLRPKASQSLSQRTVTMSYREREREESWGGG
jgi:hypothetical protein